MISIGTSNLFDRFDFCFFIIILPYIWLKPDKRKTISPTVMRGTFSRRYRRNNQVWKKNRLDRTSDARFISVWSLNFHKYPIKVTFLETSNDRRFFLEHLLGAILFLNLLIFSRSMRYIQSIRPIWLLFFPYNFTLYMVKTR